MCALMGVSCSGIAAAGFIAISLCLTVTILEMRKLKREAKEEVSKREERAARARFGTDYRPSHVAQEQVGRPSVCAAAHLLWL